MRTVLLNESGRAKNEKILSKNMGAINCNVVGCGAVFRLRAETSAAAAGLIISEVVSSNASSLADPVYGAADWIELYNNSSAPISLKGYGLSTSKNDPYAYTFPDVTLGARGSI